MKFLWSTHLQECITEVYRSHPDLYDHRKSFPWLTGSLGDPNSRIWFVGENPSLGQVERFSDQHGGHITEEAQWSGSRGDKLFRSMLVKHGFKQAPAESHGGWSCYITNAIKEADYAQRWRGSPMERRRNAALVWAPVLKWELENSRPIMVVALGKTVRQTLTYLEKYGLVFPNIITVQHYSYVALRPRGKQGPMHPERAKEYDEEFDEVFRMFNATKAKSENV